MVMSECHAAQESVKLVDTCRRVLTPGLSSGGITGYKKRRHLVFVTRPNVAHGALRVAILTLVQVDAGLAAISQSTN